MRRNDFERRRLRDLYDRNTRRVRALAEARDGRRMDRADDVAAPRRFVVSENRSRLEGFGRGGYQVQVSHRRGRGEASRRFSDKGVYRRGARDRFARDDDFDREVRRLRFRERRLNDNGARFGRLRLRRSERRELTELRRLRELQSLRNSVGRGGRRGGGNVERRREQPRRGNLDKDLDRYKNEQRGGRGRGGKRQPATKEGLDAELDRFRGGN